MSDRAQKLTRRQQRLASKGLTKDNTINFPSISSLHLALKHIEPITETQRKVVTDWADNKHLLLHGTAGTGKTFLSLYLALRELTDKYSEQRKLIIIRSAQPSKQIGFLPGDEKQKLAVYKAVYRSLFSELYGRADAFDIMEQKGIVEFTSTSFLRGTTLDNAIILYDEVQNSSKQEWLTVCTRLGETSRLLICGDTRQDDLTSQRYNETSGIVDLLTTFSHMTTTSLIEFTTDDVVRSGFVKDLILTMDKLGI